MRVFCGILASGSSERYSNEKIPKQLETLGGSALFTITLKNVVESKLFNLIVVSVIDELEKQFLDNINKELGPNDDRNNIRVTSGSETRMGSILKVINKLRESYTINDDDILCLCDANRPLVNKELYASVINEAVINTICCPARPLVDGVGLVEDGFLTAIPDKSSLQTIQTPEACNFKKLIQLIEDGKHKDKLGLCEIFLGVGIKPKVVKSDNRTYKVTYPGDIKVLEALMDHDDEQL